MFETIKSYVLSLLPEHPWAASGDPLCTDHRTLLSSTSVDNARSCPGTILVWICGKNLDHIIVRERERESYGFVILYGKHHGL